MSVALKTRELELLRKKVAYKRENRLEFYDPYPFQVEFHNDTDMRKALECANQIGKCESFSTRIDTTDGRVKIGSVFGNKCDVLTYPNYEPRKVLAWIRKPKEECFRITLVDGQWVEVPLGHRILVGSEYLFVSEIFELLPEDVFSHHQTNSVFSRLIHALDVRRLIGKVQDYLDDYLVGLRLHGALLLSDQDNVQVFAPLPVDVPQHNDHLWSLGGLAYKYNDSLSELSPPHSSRGVFQRILGLSFLTLCQVFEFFGRYMILSNQNALQSSTVGHHHQPFSESQYHLLMDSVCSHEILPSCASLTECVNKIVSVESVGYKTLYDMEVEERHNYISGGMVHHNSYAGCAEDAFDLTGLYPDWWEGHKFDRPVQLVCGGVNNDKTRDLLQKGLCGDPVMKEVSLGTGFIPKKCFGNVSLKRGVSDAFLHVKVKHFKSPKFIDGIKRDPDRYSIQDGWSQVSFQSYESGKMAWMGDTIDIFHLDEEPPMEILEQAGRGCIASGGFIRCTYTPENGATEVVRKIKDEWSLHKAGWPDVSGEDFTFIIEREVIQFKTVYTLNGEKGHLTEEKVLNAAKNFAPYQMKMRALGIPVLGSGMVFEYNEDTIKVEPLTGGIPESWPRIAAIDFGGIAKKSHPSAVIYIAYDKDNDVAYIYDGFRIYSAEIADVAARMNSRPSWIPVIWPHDGNKEVPGGSTVSKEYQNYGVNMAPTHFTNPPDDNKSEGTGGIRIEPGIVAMSNRIKDRRLRVYNTFPEWFEEYRNYHLKDGKIIDREDDLLAATRMAVQSLRHAISEADAFSYDEDDDWEQEQARDKHTGY